MNFIEQRQKVNRLLAAQSILRKELKQKQLEHKEKDLFYSNYFEAREIVTEVIRLTQQKFKERVEPLVEMAVRSVFEKEYEFRLLFEKKRNQLECRPVIIENGIEKTPKSDLGGSVVDIISCALRVVLWAIEKPRIINMMLLDEPFKNLGQQEELLLAGQVLKDVSKNLDLQLIVITHSPEFAEISDTVYQVENDGMESSVKLIKSSRATQLEEQSANKAKTEGLISTKKKRRLI